MIHLFRHCDRKIVERMYIYISYWFFPVASSACNEIGGWIISAEKEGTRLTVFGKIEKT